MVSVKFSDDEKEVLDRVIAAWRQEAEAIGSEVSASSLIRALIKREAKARGLDLKPAKATAKRGTKR